MKKLLRIRNVSVKSWCSWEGNAAANSNDYLDLKGENVQVKRLPTGFTTKGIVALVFSCVAAFLGLFTISFYGMNDIAHVEDKVARDLILTWKQRMRTKKKQLF